MTRTIATTYNPNTCDDYLLQQRLLLLLQLFQQLLNPELFIDTCLYPYTFAISPKASTQLPHLSLFLLQDLPNTSSFPLSFTP